jgi:hypothetical protein
MAKNIEKLKYKFVYKNRTIEGVMEIDLSRFEGQYSRAQYELDSMVMASMIPYMPKDTGTFINVTLGMSQAIAGSGKVVAAAPPMGRFLYEGKVMVGENTRSAFADKGERKVVTDRNLEYSKHANPKVTSHWFDTAKANHGSAWIKKTKKLAGGG